MKIVRSALLLLALSFIATSFPALSQSAKAADVICYNCPPEWADWASMLKAVKADLGYDIPARQQEFRPGAGADPGREEPIRSAISAISASPSA